MRAVLKRLELVPDPSTLSGEPDDFSLLARMTVGPTDAPGEESFDVTVCSPEWLATACRATGGIFDARHHVVVNVDTFDQRALRVWLSARVQEVEADTWSALGDRLGHLAHWEFEDYQA